MKSNLTDEKAKRMLQLLYDLKAMQVSEETGIEVSVKLNFLEGSNDS